MKKFTYFLGAMTALLVVGYFFLVKTVMPGYLEQLRPVAQQMASSYINGTIEIGQLSWQGGLSATVSSIQVKDQQQQLVAQLPKAEISFKPWLALEDPARAITKVHLQGPEVFLTRDQADQWNWQNLLKPSDNEETPFYGLLEIEQGQLHMKMPEGAWDVAINGTVDGVDNPAFGFKAQVQQGENKLNLKGRMNTKGIGSLELTSQGIDLVPYSSLASRYGHVTITGGGLGPVQLLFDNSKQVSISGQVAFNDLKGQHEALGSVGLKGTLYSKDKIITTADLVLSLGDNTIGFAGEANLGDYHQPTVEGLLSSDQLSYGPYSIGSVQLPLYVSKAMVKLSQGQAQYNGGRIGLDFTYLVDHKEGSGSLELDKLSQELLGYDLHLDGALALKAKALGEELQVEAATEAINIQWQNLKINKVNLAAALNEEGLQISDLSAWAGQGSLAFTGQIKKDGALKLQGRMAQFPINPFLELIGIGHGGSGLCSTGFAVGGNIKAPEFGAVIQLEQTELLEQKIKEAHGFVGLKDNVLTLKNFAVNLDQGQHTLHGTITLDQQEPVLDLALETANVRIEPLMKLIAPNVSVTGNLDNIMQLRGTPSKLFITGEVAAHDGSAVKNLYSSITGRYAYAAGQVTLENFLIDAFYGKVRLNGTMSPDQVLNFSLDAEGVDLSHLPISDEAVDLEGLVAARGHLSGTLIKPFFNGDITSSRLTINGEALTEVAGSLKGDGGVNNQLDVSFKQPYNRPEGDFGLYSAKLALNIPDRYLKGRVSTMWGDIGGLLRMCRQDYSIDGLMQGRLDISPRGKGSGIDINIKADNVKIHNLNYHKMAFKGRFQQYVLYFDDVRLQEQELEDKGLITVGGRVDLQQEKLDVLLLAKEANPAIATAFMKHPPEIKGIMDMTVKLEGTFANPSGQGQLFIKDGSVAGVGMDSATMALSLKDDVIELEQLNLVKDIYSVAAKGTIPVDLFRSKESWRNPQSQMAIDIDLDNARLGILPALTKMVEWGIGDIKGQVRLAGTLEEPLVFGQIKVDEGSLKLKYLSTPLDNFNLDVALEGNKILLNNMSTQLGKGSLALSGSYALRTTEQETYRLKLEAKEAELASALFKGCLNMDMEVVPQRYLDFSKMADSKEPVFGYRPLIKGSLRLDDVLVNMPTIPEMGEGSSNFGLDVKLDLGPKIHFYNSYLYDMWLSGGLHITGSTLFPVIEGTIKADKGSVTYLRTPFKLDRAALVWIEPGSFLPNVTLESTARFSRYNIFMRINGPVEAMDLQLTSDPPQERNTLVRMLTLQRDSVGSEEVTGDDIANLMTAGLQMTVLGDVEMFVKQTLGLDQFRIYTGRVRTGIGMENARDRGRELTEDERNQYNVLVSKYIGTKFMLGYTTSFDAVSRSVFGQYDLSRRLNLTYSRTYDLAAKPEDWYGLEYKISF